ncbi:MAG: phosphate ABC transporter permease subunit PstC [Mariprofundaceae bacterium]|nr:phosphate ABC transporter permease subunit PstC [Mariprofundaceae bacterium]
MAWHHSLHPLKLFIGLGCFIAALSIFILLGFLIQSSLPFWQAFGITSLWGKEWYPYESLYGFLPAIVGTIWALIIAMLIAVPCGVSAAIVSSEILSPAWRNMARIGMEVLAGIPSVVYGLIGLWVLLPFLQHSLDLLTGHNLLASGIILSLMILPTIMVMSQDALQAVSAEQRESAMNLGLNENQCLYRVLLPQAWSGIRSGMLLALGRALGETMAVMLVVGSMDRLPQPFYNILEPAQTLTSRIGREMGEAAFGSLHFSALMGCGLILAIIAMALSLFAYQKQATS